MNALTRGGVLMITLLLLSTSEVQAVIKVPSHLRLFVGDSTQIVQVRIGKFSPEKSAGNMMFEVEQDIKGKWGQRSLPVVWKLDSKIEPEVYLTPFLKSVGTDQQAILFINDGGKFWHTMQRKDPVAYGFSNGSWFFLIGKKGDGDKIVWSLSQGEPYLRTTFKGTTAELNKVLVDHLAGKGKLPELVKEEPGFGPAYLPKK